MRKNTWIAVLSGTAFMASLAVTPIIRADDKKIDFVKDIQPILATSCVACHGADPKGKKPKGKYDLTTKAGALKGGENKKDLVPGNAKESLFYTTLLAAVGSGDDEVGRMPYKKDPLSADQIKLLMDWINQGAAWPDDVKVSLKE
jgi:mono/diheme cytochrome c family protein